MSIAPTRAASAPAQAPSTRWILGRGRDLLLFVGTPLLLIPLVLAAQQFWSAPSLYAIATFGALGHHLPGMIRAYGDRELFARFRTRFVLAPILLVAVCIVSIRLDPAMSAIVLVTYLWGVWHGLMQTHGFLRIYDAKAASFGRLTAALDQWMCITWFVAVLLFSTNTTHHVLQELAMAGGPLVPSSILGAVRGVWAVLTAVITLAFLVHLFRSLRTGQGPNPVKLLLLVTSIGMWWYANRVVSNLLIGILLFELFHDVQYLAIVWIYNRRRVAQGAPVDRFTRFVFRDRAPLILLYVGCVAAYGALRFVHPPTLLLDSIFVAILAASALLHFYFDSFIWKVKDRDTRAGLGLAGGSTSTQRRPALVPMTLRWAVFAAPLVWLAVGQTRGVSDVAAMESLGREFPRYALAQHNLAVALLAEDRFEEATAAARLALQLETNDQSLRADATQILVGALGGAAGRLIERGEIEAAASLTREATALQPGAARVWFQDGVARARDADAPGASALYQAALLLEPDSAPILGNLALALAARGQLPQALAAARRAAALAPGDGEITRILQRVEAAMATP
jgi:Flp pilus assembly protein TadD